MTAARQIAAASIGFACIAAGCRGFTPKFDGPLPARSQHPAQLTVQQLEPIGVNAPRAGAVVARWNNAYSSLFLGGQGPNANSFAMDGEVLRSALATRIGLGAGLSLEVEIPAGISGGGFLDGFVIDWHDLFGFPDQGRQESPRDRFFVEARSGGQAVYRMDETVGLFDLPISATWTVLPLTEERPYGVAIRAGIELPTGDQDRGFGNGEIDVAVGVATEFRTGQFAFTGQIQHTFAGNPNRAERQGFRFADVTAGSASAEWAFAEGWAALVQVGLERSTLRQLNFDRVSADQWSLWTGGRAKLSEATSVELAVGEDLEEFIAPDFTVWLGLRHEFGAEHNQ